jgi:ketosteroid isomerase-like protein
MNKTEEARRVALEFLKAFYTTGDFSEMLADDFELYLAIDGPLGGGLTKEQFLDIPHEHTGPRWWDSPVRAHVGAVTAEDDRVAVEDGRQYHSQFHYLVRVRDGKVTQWKQYMDTLHVSSFWDTDPSAQAKTAALPRSRSSNPALLPDEVTIVWDGESER